MSDDRKTASPAPTPVPTPVPPQAPTPTDPPAQADDAASDSVEELGGPKGPEPTRFGDWERNGRCSDF